MPEEIDEPTGAQLGGLTTSERYGKDHYQRMGQLGGTRTRDTHGPDYYARIGRLGGTVNAERHNAEHFREMGRRGAKRLKELIAKGKASEEGSE